MKKLLARIFIKSIGWKVAAQVTPAMKHSVMVAAPHTSNWDFPIALAAFWIMGLDLKFLIKSEYTRGPLGPLFRWAGAIGVDRSQRRNQLTDFAVELLQRRELVLMIPPEGTREAVEQWHLGFYHIARRAGVPISLGTLDYRRKVADVLAVLPPTGDVARDMATMEDYFRPIVPRHPEGYNPRIYRG